MIGARFLAEAEAEFAEAAEFYERAERGLGAAFLLEVERTVERIRTFPESGAKFSRSTRARLVNNFPFWVVYRFEREEIVVLAIAHQRRRVGYWKRRKDAPR